MRLELQISHFQRPALLLLFCLCSWTAAYAQTDQASVTGDVQTVDGDIKHVSRNVNGNNKASVLVYKDMRIEADEITFNQATNMATAGPHVIMTRGDEHIEGDRLEMNVETKVGTIYHANGYIGPGYYFTASQVDRLADQRYLLHSATITTCDAKKPGWSLRMKKALAEPGQSVKASNGIFNLQGIPLFYLPYVVAPTIDRERASGFLIPSTSTSTTKGRTIRESFYWAISRSMDATFTGDYFSARGPAAETDFRAVPNKDSRLDMAAFYVDDRTGQGGLNVRVLDYVDLGHGYRAVADANLVSSIVFRQIYEDGLSVITSPIEDSLAFLTRNQTGYSYNIEYKRTAIFFPTQPTTVMTEAPSFEGALTQRRLGTLPAYFNFDGGFAGIGRRDSAIDTPGMAARMDLHPSLEIPVLKSPDLQWSNELGVQETGYTASRGSGDTNGPAFNRLTFNYSSLLSGPQLERDFGKLRHVIEPSVEYKYVTGANNFQNTIVVDNTDLVTDTNQVEYAITNRIYSTRELFSWRIAQDYFMNPTFGGAAVPGQRNVFAPLLGLTGFAYAGGPRRFSPIVSTMRVATTPGASTDILVDYDTQTRQFDGAGIIGGLSHGSSNGGVAYFFRSSSSVQAPADQFQGSYQFGNATKSGLSLGLRAAYDIEHKVFQGSTAEIRYNTDCYGLSVEINQYDIGARKETRILFAFTLKDIGSYGTIRRQDRLF